MVFFTRATNLAPGLGASSVVAVDRGNGTVGNNPINPFTGQPAAITPVTNYAGSFGDNFCGGPQLNGGAVPQLAVWL